MPWASLRYFHFYFNWMGCVFTPRKDVACSPIIFVKHFVGKARHCFNSLHNYAREHFGILWCAIIFDWISIAEMRNELSKVLNMSWFYVGQLCAVRLANVMIFLLRSQLHFSKLRQSNETEKVLAEQCGRGKKEISKEKCAQFQPVQIDSQPNVNISNNWDICDYLL